MARTALDRAERLFSAGRDAEVISLLEPQVPVYRESPRFYYILGSACLRSGDLGGASAYLKRAEQLDPSGSDVTLALAALCVRKGETDKAVTAYLKVLDEHPADRRAKEALSLLRTEGSPERLTLLVQSGKVAKLYPHSGRATKRIVIAIAAIAVAASAIALGPALLRLVHGLAKPARPEVAAVSLSESERSSPVTSGGSFTYVMTEREAIAAFERAKSLFQDYRDNAALVEVNRLLNSNASAAVKQKAASLKAFVGAPDFRTIRDIPAFADVAREAGLYDGCAVAWKGMAANIREDRGEIVFDFLVGYHDKKRLEGIISGSAQGIPIPVDRPLELLAVIRVAGGKARLVCVAVHELVAGSGS
jgi:tetratricopeptide (TPR) repeat protein